jgi:hypothetical protein
VNIAFKGVHDFQLELFYQEKSGSNKGTNLE